MEDATATATETATPRELPTGRQPRRQRRRGHCNGDGDLGLVLVLQSAHWKKWGLWRSVRDADVVYIILC